MQKFSAGLLLYRWNNKILEVFLVHPGGPFWMKKDVGAWSIPKGEMDTAREQDLLETAQREFHEETGCTAQGEFMPLSPVKLKSGKIIHAWAMQGECDPATITSNTFSMEWPPRSGKQAKFPEVDRAAWFDIEEAKKRIHEGQLELLRELQSLLMRTGTLT